MGQTIQPKATDEAIMSAQNFLEQASATAMQAIEVVPFAGYTQVENEGDLRKLR